MNKAKGFIVLSLLAVIPFVGFNQFNKVSAQTESNSANSFDAPPDRAADLILADKIRQLTDRSGDDLTQQKAFDGGTELDLGEGFQNVVLARAENDGEPTAACITSLGEADAFFGRDLQTGAAIPQTEFRPDSIEKTAARYGMSKTEYEFYNNLIAQAAKNNPSLVSSSTITISNGDAAGEGFNDASARSAEGGNNGATLGQQRLNLFNYAAGIWSAYLDSGVPIVVNSQFNSLAPCSTNGGVLGSAGSTGLTRDFTNAPQVNTWYPTSLASKLSGVDRNGATAEINAIFNSDIDTGCIGAGTRFYYGLDNSSPAGTFNLLTVLLHELGHGLGFTSSVNGTTGQLAGNDTQGRFPDAFTRLMYDRTTGKYWSQMTDAERVTSSTNNGNVLFDGANVKNASSFLTVGREDATGRVQLYTPTTYQGGSSISHWDIAATPNLLMEPNLTISLPLTLDLTRQQMRDIGWYRDSNTDLTPDTITNVQVSAATLAIGSRATVSWTNNGGFVRNVSIEISTDGGATFAVSVASNVANTGSYQFTVPSNAGSQSRIRVREADFVAPLGSSGNFTISSPPPTAAAASVSGRVTTANGRGIANAVLKLTGSSSGETKFVKTNPFGNYTFSGVSVGETYLISVSAKQYSFSQTSRIVSINQNFVGLDFMAIDK